LKFLYTVDARLQKLTGHLIRHIYHIDFRAISFQEANVLKSCFGINYTDETQAVITACLGHADAHVARTGFDNDRFPVDSSGFQSLLKDQSCRSVFHASSRIEPFQLGI
jgi:hypothetical protein